MEFDFALSENEIERFAKLHRLTYELLAFQHSLYILGNRLGFPRRSDKELNLHRVVRQAAKNKAEPRAGSGGGAQESQRAVVFGKTHRVPDDVSFVVETDRPGVFPICVVIDHGEVIVAKAALSFVAEYSE